MPRSTLWLVMLVLGGQPASGGAQAGKQPIPTKVELAKAEALIQELYQGDFAKAKNDAAARLQLAQLLLQEAKETTDFAAGRYQLLVHARQLASAAGDGPTALHAIEELAQSFAVPAKEVFALKIDALALATSAAATPPAYQMIADSALALLEEALALDDFAAAFTLLAAAEAAGKKLRSVPLVSAIRRRHDEVANLHKEYSRWESHARKLAVTPDDPAANEAMGQYYALVLGNWERGLPHLAKGRGPLGELARREAQSGPPLELGDRWYEQAMALPENLRQQALLRAYHWYQIALAEAEGHDSLAVEKRLAAVNDRLPPELRSAEIVQEFKKLDGHAGPVYGAAFSPDGKWTLSAGADACLRLWDTKTGKELRRLDGHTGRIWCVAFAPDGRRAASGSFDGTVRVWDLLSGREIRRFAHNDYVRSVVFSHDGRFLLSGGDDRLVRLWNLETAKEVRQFKGHDHFVWCVAWSRDGKRALSASLDKTVRLWNVDTGEQLHKLTGHTDTVLAVAFAPDGRRAVSGSTDKNVILWELDTGTILTVFEGHQGYVHSVAFSPDGRRI
ncbi:MAG: WD40 repeat domain-containing protein, partial [Gemmataceae bacterium]|nr:WD40 repeat domain-containing protein [Gemmataceae bacterium]